MSLNLKLRLTSNLGKFHLAYRWQCANDGAEVKAIAEFTQRNKLFVVITTANEFNVYEIHQAGETRQTRLIQKMSTDGKYTTWGRERFFQNFDLVFFEGVESSTKSR